MKIKKEITLVSISDIKIKETIKSLLISNKKLNPAKTLLFSSKSIYLNKNEKKFINVIKINPISSIRKYSEFIIFSLYKYISTSHVLIVQWDGFIINSENWNNDFLKYDYIGAPFIPRDDDKNYSRDDSGGFYSIGNGGFSLRSKKLLAAPSQLKLKDNFELTNFHEDGFFSVLQRKYLESKGYKWAPFDTALKFAIESPLSFNDLIFLPFGFHGKKIYYLLILNILFKKIFRNNEKKLK